MTASSWHTSSFRRALPLCLAVLVMIGVPAVLVAPVILEYLQRKQAGIAYEHLTRILDAACRVDEVYPLPREQE